MSGYKFVVQEGHFHIADKDSYVLTGWFDGADAGKEAFEVFLDCERLKVQVLHFADELVRQKYAKYDLKVTEEYVIIAKLPPQLAGYRRLFLCLKGGGRIYERRVSQLKKLRNQLNYRISSIQITGASCVLSGWAASHKPIKINVFDKSNVPMKCEVSHFPKPDVALEYREVQQLYDSGFSVTVPMNGRKKLVLQITNGEASVKREFSAVDKNRLVMYVKKAHYYMKRNGMKKACKRVVNELYELAGDTGSYMNWRKKNLPPAKELDRQRQEAGPDGPVVYAVTPYADSRNFYDTARSLTEQTYPHWKWVVACTAEQQAEILEKLKDPCSQNDIIKEKRILFVPLDKKPDFYQKTAQAMNQAAALICAAHGAAAGAAAHLGDGAYAGGRTDAQGAAPAEQPDLKNAWITLLGPADTLEPDAFYACAQLMKQNPDMDMCYTDEDQISADGKLYFDPVFKSDLNIDMLRAVNYLGHMVLVRADAAARLDGWNPAYGAQASYDYYLRAVEKAGYAGHLQKAVYHVRAAEKSGEADSTRSAGLDPSAENGGQAADASIEILNAHYSRLGIPAKVCGSGTPGIYHTKYAWPDTPMVSVNIPNKDHIDDLDTCVQSVLSNCRYPNYEIVIIENNSTEESTFAYYEKLKKQDARVRVIYWKEEFNYSRITNFGVSESNGEYILLLNNDTEVMTPDFMEEMLGYCMRPDVGACGARLYYFDNTIQHAGVVVGLGGICGEVFQGFARENGGYQNRIFCPQDYCAVTAACLMTPKRVFEEAGGMDEDFQIAYNDIDYCLKVRRSGRLIVYNPYAVLHHYEYKSRGVENTPAKLARYNREVDLFTTRWADLISGGDPYYNPNLTRRYQDFSLRRIELLK